MIYRRFKIAGQTITTRMVRSLPGGEYGKFNDAKNEITLAETVEIDGEIVELSKEQLENSYYHEVIHAFQFYYNNEFDEAQAQVYANFLCELAHTAEGF